MGLLKMLDGMISPGPTLLYPFSIQLYHLCDMARRMFFLNHENVKSSYRILNVNTHIYRDTLLMFFFSGEQNSNLHASSQDLYFVA